MKIIPLNDKVIIEKINNEEKIGEIYLPKSNNDLVKGKVIEVNKEKTEFKESKSFLIKKDDIVLFKEGYNVEKYKIENIDYYFVKESDIFGLIK